MFLPLVHFFFFSPSHYFSGECLLPIFLFRFKFLLLVTLDSLHFALKRLFVRVCRVVESEGRVLDFGELVPSDCVLCRLSEEFFGLVSPALDTWKVVRG